MVFACNWKPTSTRYSFNRRLISCTFLHAEPVDCGVLGDPDNGQVDTSDGTTLESIATYTCNDGFCLEGDSMRVCQPDGTWSGDEPTCGKETIEKGY